MMRFPRAGLVTLHSGGPGAPPGDTKIPCQECLIRRLTNVQRGPDCKKPESSHACADCKLVCAEERRAGPVYWPVIPGELGRPSARRATRCAPHRRPSAPRLLSSLGAAKDNACPAPQRIRAERWLSPLPLAGRSRARRSGWGLASQDGMASRCGLAPSRPPPA
jgi:hypothetical protein